MNRAIRAVLALGIAFAPVPVLAAGYNSGTDWSVNAPAVPISGYVLLTTIPANPGRSAVEIQDQSAGAIQVVRDDGAGNNVSSIMLASGGAAGTQGGDWQSTTFRGRVRVYGASGAQVMATED